MASLTGDGWQRLNQHLRLSERLAASSEPVFVSADIIKQLTGREPRLMSKFDTRESRPPALADATILPVTNGSYAILPGDGYADVPAPSLIKHWRPSKAAARLGSLPWDTGPTSESQILDMANATGLLHDFLEDEDACLTIRGRLRSPRFEFEFDTPHGRTPLAVDGVQIEVDSGFEGSQLHLIEAKLGARSNFHVRQLYYPLRMWAALLPQKPISALFLAWSNRCYSLRKFLFDPVRLYHSWALAKSVDYYLDEPAPIPSLEQLLESTPEEDSPLPFPQADDVRRVIDIVDAVAAGVVARPEIAARFDINERQADYYANAAAYLGLVRRLNGGFEPTSEGKQFVSQSFSRRQTALLQRLLRRPVFRRAAEALCTTGGYPSKEQIGDWISSTTRLSGETPLRRAGTVIAWLRWAEQATRRTQLELSW